ncbi:MAG TPA: cupin domain-containing protein [Acidobacteriaceae bacterium]|nr:cupin domain-containing protein [Acidobacteriaceae bacterium]
MNPTQRKTAVLIVFSACLFSGSRLQSEERTIDPTFLHRDTATVAERKSDISTQSCHYKPLFGEGDAQTSVVVGVARYGEAVVDPKGDCAAVQYPAEDQVYVVLDGNASVNYGGEVVPLKKEDYLYVPATITHTLRNLSGSPLTVVIMGFRTRGFERETLPPHPLHANIEDVRTQPVKGHPLSAMYRLLMGDSESKRDRIAAGHVLTSLFLMEIAPGGTNFPHHHEREEEIYLVLTGHGDMVAGGGMDGIEGKHPAKAGDAYFFRLNCTVGYYSAPGVKSRILAVRSWYPGMQQKGAQH